ncbi:uncharacterized protein C8R40DRAFT_52862 [Lentinula edodes]|uniref:uncharacterized protein n=1 Tax=Lentinula edodes TaxID=5353 RepID=UPI001E8EA180|nr:uncharacterized protein C8R40DRAFT_52862 [Lentinula edodes]KAH7881573.1 hypothetical protein C8R40DRAFT_52862 [Lentinula edodes]
MDIFTFISDGYVDRYANLAGCTLLLYDYLLTLDDEIEFIWRKSWSIGKVLFIISRYYSLIVTIAVNNYAFFGGLSGSVSFQFSHWQGWSGLITCMIVETILQMRLYALYFLDKRILSLMIVSFIVSSASTAAVWVILTRGNFSTQLEFPFCLIKMPDYCYAIWIPRLAFGTLLCILALIRGFQLAKDESSVFESSTLPSGRILMKVLIRDCIGSYLVLFTVYLTFLTIWLKNTNLIETCFSLSVAFESIVGTRTILSIRKVTTSGGPDV